jgi:hypothetical protein
MHPVHLVCGLQDWVVVRDVVNHEWRHPSLYNTDDMQPGQKRFLQPRFIQGCSFNFMQPAGQSVPTCWCFYCKCCQCRAQLSGAEAVPS